MSVFAQNNCFEDASTYKENQQYKNIKEKQEEEMIVLSISSGWRARMEAVNPAMRLIKKGVLSQQEASAKARQTQAGVAGHPI